MSRKLRWAVIPLLTAFGPLAIDAWVVAKERTASAAPNMDAPRRPACEQAVGSSLTPCRTR